jgi:hypothetical protein
MLVELGCELFGDAFLSGCAKTIVDRTGLLFTGFWRLDERAGALDLVGHGGSSAFLRYTPRRVPVGVGSIGLAATPSVGDSPTVRPPSSTVPTFTAFPLQVYGRTVGVLAVLAMAPLPQQLRDYLKQFAGSVVAEAVVSARGSDAPVGES